MAHPQVTAATSRGLVLDVVRSEGPISRVELAERTGLTQASISHLVRALLRDGLLVETGERTYTGGKPRVMLTLDPSARCGVGVQLGADWIVIVVADASGAEVARTRVHGARGRQPDDVVSDVAAHVDLTLRIAGVEHATVAGIGLVAPGALDLDAGSIRFSPSLTTWEGYPVQELLEQRTGLPVVLDNDATAAAIGEFWNGAISASVAHGTIYMGATIGAGIVIAGSVYRGASSNTGPLGRLRFGAADRPTLEELAGPAAVAAQARAALAGGRPSQVRLSADGDPFSDFSAVATAAVRGDALCIELIEGSADRLADAALIAVDMFDLDSVVLAGPSLTIAGSLYLRLIERRVRAESYVAGIHRVAVKLSMQVTDAAAVGAASLVLQNDLAPRQLGIG
ncbi:ROK family transcriptional regulator [Flexivirga sp.]|uniref:ROK family transcriptional regulator n=1 Tax=Flexivirga sp. TaxID=1962927 RepID=UPI002D7F4A8E|nr:ROK family transcriptional regulator [Flexivirga sp.]